jgi:hypothetical protein
MGEGDTRPSSSIFDLDFDLERERERDRDLERERDRERERERDRRHETPPPGALGADHWFHLRRETRKTPHPAPSSPETPPPGPLRFALSIGLISSSPE